MEKFLDNVETENGVVSVWFNSMTKKPMSVLFYPSLAEDEFVEILLEDIPNLLREIEKVTGQVVKLVDARDLKSLGCNARPGSIPGLATK